MKKVLIALFAMSLVFAFVACGDDSDDGASGAFKDKMDGVTCDPTPTDACDAMLCGVKSTYDTCAAVSSANCAPYITCMETYYNCLGCGAGELDATKSADCSTAYQTCATNAAKEMAGM